MDILSYSKKTKCQGCTALDIGEDGYYCRLGVDIQTDKQGGEEFRPTPLKKCWKPKTVLQFKEVIKKLKKTKNFLESR